MQVLGAFGGMIDISLFVARHTHKYSEAEEVPADGHELTALVMKLQGERESKRAQCGFQGERQQAVTEDTERDLGVRPFKYGAGQAEQYVAAPIVFGKSPRLVGQIGGALIEPGAIAFDMQNPAGLPRKPFSETVGMSADCSEVAMCRGHERIHQQRAQCAREFLM
jgi:hypothetical protein